MPKVFFKKYFDARKLAQEEQNFIVNEDEIKISSCNTSIILKKETINKISFDKDSIYLYTSINSWYIIKERYLGNKSEFLSLKEFIKIHYM
jgi:hypothetical protein